MKKNIFSKGVLVMTLGAALASCSSDYLDRAPITITDETAIGGTVDGCQRAAWGICRSMYQTYAISSQVQFMNGEAYVNTVYGEAFAADDILYNWQDGFGAQFSLGQFMRNTNSWIPSVPWMYSYNLISQSNKVLSLIPGAQGSDNEKKHIRAQVLTLRAHAYIKLLQYYGPRWEDSKNGEELTVVYRTEYGTGDAPLGSMNQVLKLIYDDLGEAIDLFEETKMKRQQNYEPDVTVAHGLLARAALLKNDWETARDEAAAARKDYTIMSPDDYCAGFAAPTSEWMWFNDNDLNDMEVGITGFGSLLGCNGSYVSSWGLGAGAISYDLYRLMNTNDCRRKLYWTPDKLPRSPLLRASHFWNADRVQELSMNMNIVEGASTKPLMVQALTNFMNDALPGGNISTFRRQAYRSTASAEDDLIGVVPFGAQVKFWSTGDYSSSCYPFMRASEMALIEAEARCMLKDYTLAQTALDDVRKNRISGYTGTTATGDALLQEIRNERRIELWGEGFSWTDLKRWKLPMVRNPWVEGDINSNNFPPRCAGTVDVDANQGWRYVIPNSEVNHNDLIRGLVR